MQCDDRQARVAGDSVGMDIDWKRLARSFFRPLYGLALHPWSVRYVIVADALQFTQLAEAAVHERPDEMQVIFSQLKTRTPVG